jgi:hypothetical protein
MDLNELFVHTECWNFHFVWEEYAELSKQSFVLEGSVKIHSNMLMA